MTTHHLMESGAVRFARCGGVIGTSTLSPRWIDVDCSACLERKPSLFEALTALRDDFARRSIGGCGEYDAGYAAACESAVEDIDQVLAAYAREQIPCTCGYGGYHEPLNPNCGRNRR